MKKASISEAKNRLSAIIDRVRSGDSVLIEDRGVPVARLEPVAGADPRGRVARLERQGVLRRAQGAVSAALLRERPPRTQDGTRASDALIEDRRNGR